MSLFQSSLPFINTLNRNWTNKQEKISSDWKRSWIIRRNTQKKTKILRNTNMESRSMLRNHKICWMMLMKISFSDFDWLSSFIVFCLMFQTFRLLKCSMLNFKKDCFILHSYCGKCKMSILYVLISQWKMIDSITRFISSSWLLGVYFEWIIKEWVT